MYDRDYEQRSLSTHPNHLMRRPEVYAKARSNMLPRNACCIRRNAICTLIDNATTLP